MSTETSKSGNESHGCDCSGSHICSRTYLYVRSFAPVTAVTAPTNINGLHRPCCSCDTARHGKPAPADVTHLLPGEERAAAEGRRRDQSESAEHS